MAEETIVAKGTYLDKDKKEVAIEISAPYDFGDSHDDMVAEFGADVVYHHAKSNMKVAFQGALRNAAQQGLVTGTPDLASYVKNWPMPSGKPRGISKMDKAKILLAGLPEADRAALIAELTE